MVLFLWGRMGGVGVSWVCGFGRELGLGVGFEKC